jgi:diguanylate cyclase (GGDEF)-like protein
MQIRTLFLACMGATAALGTCLSGWMLMQMVGEYRLAGRVEHVVDIDALIFAAADKIAAERPVTFNALLKRARPDRATQDTIAAARAETDIALSRVERRIAAWRFSGADAQSRIIRKIAGDLAALRAGADTALAVPRSERDPTLVSTYLKLANAMFDMSSAALDVGDMAAALHDGTTVELITLSRYAWGLRSAMTLRTAPLMTAIDAGLLLDTDALAAQIRVDGIYKQIWDMIGVLTTRLSEIDGLAAAVSHAREAFDTYETLCQEVIRAGRFSADYPVAALDLGRVATRTAPVFLQLRDEAVSAARAQVARSRRSAEIYVCVATLVLAVTTLAIAAVLVLLQRRIVSPVLSLTEAIDRIAKSDFDVVISDCARMDEIGRMAAALETLRRGAIAAEAQRAQIAHMARHDALTGLPNRIVLQEWLERAVVMARRGHIAAVMCLDLDGFKAVNDTFGHATGDLLLQGVAARLQACLREADIVSRIGGDEFVVLLMAVGSGEQAAIAARRIVDALSEPFDIDGQCVAVGCSIGIAITPRDATGHVALLKCADRALYRAKAEGKGGWRFFVADIDDRVETERGGFPAPADDGSTRGAAGQVAPPDHEAVSVPSARAAVAGESGAPHRLHKV